MIPKQRIKEALRRVTAPGRATPSAIIVGAQRSGTSSLFGYLRAHPKIKPSIQKEVHYFDLNFVNGLNWYREHFPLRAELAYRRAISIEASPYYVFHPRALHRIKHVLPQAKIIVLLRNPTERAISHYFHEVRKGHERLPMLDAFAREEERLEGELDKLQADETYRSLAHQHFSYKSRGVYVGQIERCLELFGRENVHIIHSEVMFRSTQSVLNDAYAFLGLPPFSPEVLVRRGKPGGYAKEEIPNEAYQSLQAYFEPHNQRLYQLLGRDFGW